MTRATIALALLLGATDLRAAGHVDCPMAGTPGHHAEVERRHAKVTGVAHESAVHRFVPSDEGGSIRLEVVDAAQTKARDRIREHLQAVARAFAAGDFAIPMFIHDQVPPGVDLMKERKAAIHYDYASTEGGGQITISTRDPEAVAAIHEFLRFQTSDHGASAE